MVSPVESNGGHARSHHRVNDHDYDNNPEHESLWPQHTDDFAQFHGKTLPLGGRSGASTNNTTNLVVTPPSSLPRKVTPTSNKIAIKATAFSSAISSSAPSSNSLRTPPSVTAGQVKPAATTAYWLLRRLLPTTFLVSAFEALSRLGLWLFIALFALALISPMPLLSSFATAARNRIDLLACPFPQPPMIHSTSGAKVSLTPSFFGSFIRHQDGVQSDKTSNDSSDNNDENNNNNYTHIPYLFPTLDPDGLRCRIEHYAASLTAFITTHPHYYASYGFLADPEEVQRVAKGLHTLQALTIGAADTLAEHTHAVRSLAAHHQRIVACANIPPRRAIFFLFGPSSWLRLFHRVDDCHAATRPHLAALGTQAARLDRVVHDDAKKTAHHAAQLLVTIERQASVVLCPGPGWPGTTRPGTGAGAGSGTKKEKIMMNKQQKGLLKVEEDYHDLLAAQSNLCRDIREPLRRCENEWRLTMKRTGVHINRESKQEDLEEEEDVSGEAFVWCMHTYAGASVQASVDIQLKLMDLQESSNLGTV